MPLKSITEKARRDMREGKSSRTAAGEFVREEIRHVRAGQHGVRNTRQAIAIGLSEARRAGIPVPPPGRGASTRTRRAAARDAVVGREGPRKPSRRRSRATISALKREPRAGASSRALSLQARGVAARRTPAARSRSAQKAAATRRRTRRVRVQRGR